MYLIFLLAGTCQSNIFLQRIEIAAVNPMSSNFNAENSSLRMNIFQPVHSMTNNLSLQSDYKHEQT